MRKYTVEELDAWADEFELKIRRKERKFRGHWDADHPGYRRWWTTSLRSLARQKERAREHKVNQRKGRDLKRPAKASLRSGI